MYISPTYKLIVVVRARFSSPTTSRPGAGPGMYVLRLLQRDGCLKASREREVGQCQGLVTKQLATLVAALYETFPHTLISGCYKNRPLPL